jgi:hypothetical protein
VTAGGQGGDMLGLTSRVERICSEADDLNPSGVRTRSRRYSPKRDHRNGRIPSFSQCDGLMSVALSRIATQGDHGINPRRWVGWRPYEQSGCGRAEDCDHADDEYPAASGRRQEAHSAGANHKLGVANRSL